MMKRKEYVRTTSGEIGVITTCPRDLKKDYGKEIWMKSSYEYSIVTNHIEKSSFDVTDLLKDGDLCVITFYSPRYSRRVKRLFQIECTSEKDKYINFQNAHCNLFMINGDWSNHDKKLKPIIKSVITRELLESVEYRI